MTRGVLKTVIGVGVIAAAVALARGWRLAPASSRFRRPLVVGSISGALRTLTGIAGPPVIIYLLAENFDQERLRATILAFFLPATLVTVVLFAIAGELTSPRLTPRRHSSRCHSPAHGSGFASRSRSMRRSPAA